MLLITEELRSKKRGAAFGITSDLASPNGSAMGLAGVGPATGPLLSSIPAACNYSTQLTGLASLTIASPTNPAPDIPNLLVSGSGGETATTSPYFFATSSFSGSSGIGITTPSGSLGSACSGLGVGESGNVGGSVAAPTTIPSSLGLAGHSTTVPTALSCSPAPLNAQFALMDVPTDAFTQSTYHFKVAINVNKMKFLVR
ncbi:unnamed protein product [Protopolystoma xenopodis]|uniref:Uncharacterized protein n=1 Tax=Protopolystoma xenopodis TaxID=117903 RepID=A0A448XC71_9PLAT|nr:unnamed protein product [Protopolystoma xenopodis]